MSSTTVRLPTYRLEYQPTHLIGTDTWRSLPGFWHDRQDAVAYADASPSYPHRVIETVTTETVVYQRDASPREPSPNVLPNSTGRGTVGNVAGALETGP